MWIAGRCWMLDSRERIIRIGTVQCCGWRRCKWRLTSEDIVLKMYVSRLSLPRPSQTLLFWRSRYVTPLCSLGQRCCLAFLLHFIAMEILNFYINLSSIYLIWCLVYTNISHVLYYKSWYSVCCMLYVIIVYDFRWKDWQRRDRQYWKGTMYMYVRVDDVERCMLE